MVNQIFLQIVTGLQLGAIYVLIALGLTLIFGTLGVVNFTHGALFMLGAFSAVIISGNYGFVAAIIIVPPFLFFFGVLMERFIVRFFYDRPHTDQILVTFGFAIVIQETLKWIFGSNNIPFKMPAWGRGILKLHEYVPFLDGFVAYPKWRFILITVSFFTVIALFALLQFTRFGMVIRAGMNDSEILSFLGINITRRFTLVFGLGSMIAGLAGVFAGPVTNVDPGLGMFYLVPSFLVVVIGGMGSLPGAVLASFLLGMAQSFTVSFAGLQAIVVYIVAVVVLLFMPRGLLGKKGVLD
ncbi:MAG: branched-chain amino acid ABC transporter permease [SAR324 cluster bacterium]|nr:branched-chain amino acid ABC transporter permease [SAR324 cluster bacterium]